MISKLSELSKAVKGLLENLPTQAPILLGVNPVPACRPRVTRWGVFYTKTYNNWRTEAKKFITQSEKKFTGPLVVLVELYGKKPKTTKRHWPRGDVDNYAKGPLDLLTKHAECWNDDDQVVGLWVTKQYAEPGEERTVITIYELNYDK